MQLDDANQVHGYFTALLVEKYNLFSLMFSSQLFSFANFPKTRDKASRNIYNFQFHNQYGKPVGGFLTRKHELTHR
jgi:hypothetical protein